MIYICYIIYKHYVMTSMLAVGDNELAVRDDDDASSEAAGGGHVQEVSEKSRGRTNGMIRQSGSGLPAFGGPRGLIDFVITIFIGIFVFYSLLQIE
jgi:hypothetical protein